MNLVGGKWIPVVLHSGTHERVSLREAFERGADIRDLHARPHERIALMRLLICIAQAALKGPKSRPAWEDLENEPTRMTADTIKYLEAWCGHFELFGDGPRFLQTRLAMRSAKTGKPKKPLGLSKLDLMLANGNSPTVFDNEASGDRRFSPEQLAICTIAFQCFAPWKLGQGYEGCGPCLSGNALHAFTIGENLLATIALNLLPRDLVARNYTFDGCDGWGHPAWELQTDQDWPKSDLFEEAERTYLGRLVPLKWRLFLAPERNELYVDNGFELPAYHEGFREPSLTVCSNGSKDWILPVSLRRASWRSLHSILARQAADDKGGLGGPLVWQNIAGTRGFRLWTGGAVGGDAKLEELLESTFDIPAAMSANVERQERYRRGVDIFAAGWAESLKVTVAGSKEKKDGFRGYAEALGFLPAHAKALSERAEVSFWTEVEKHLAELFAVTTADRATLPYDEKLNLKWEETPWGEACRRAAESAFDRTCPHGNPRQLQAWALARRRLRPPLPVGAKPAKRGPSKTRKPNPA